MICLGCAAKVDLLQLYPVLEELSSWLSKNTGVTIQQRDDVYIAETDGSYTINRAAFRVEDIERGNTSGITSAFERFKPSGIIMLANFMPFPTNERLLRIFKEFYSAAGKGHAEFTVGKGHTIQIAKNSSEEYIIVDFIRTWGNGRYLVANNDTISHIDPALEPSSWLNVFIAFNNALNDLFLCGVTTGANIYPTCDRRLECNGQLGSSVEMFSRYFPQFHVHRTEYIDFNTKSVGATVVGVTDKEIPRNSNLQGGEVLIATRPLGDLAPLTEYLIRQMTGEDTAPVQKLREHVLNIMVQPNLEAAEVINRNLPSKGGPFDPQRHIYCCRDVSGAGILTLEELAEDSGVDITLDRIVFHDESLAYVDMPNPTSGTNGAIIIGCKQQLAQTVLAELKSADLEPWIVGRTLPKSGKEPKIIINESLTKYPFIRGALGQCAFKNFAFKPQTD